MFSAVNLFQFQLQKGSCLKKYLILQNFHGVFRNFKKKNISITLQFSGPRFNFSPFLEINPSPPIHRNVNLHFLFQKTDFASLAITMPIWYLYQTKKLAVSRKEKHFPLNSHENGNLRKMSVDGNWDLLATCTSRNHRNFSLGKGL